MLYLFIRILIVAIFWIYMPPSYAAFTELKNFGENPGELNASYYQSKKKLPNAALVVLLHGCGQNGERFAQQSGFLEQAKQHHFSLLIPQQNSNNHSKLCFNWYDKADHQKNAGENLSLKNMIEEMKTLSKAKQVYIVGLSAGGAMTSSMLMNYPELFAGGAVVAGLPYPCAEDLTQALACMKYGPSKKLLTEPHEEGSHQKWPRLTIWTGRQDKIVNPVNAQLLAQQWALLTGARLKSSLTDKNTLNASSLTNIVLPTNITISHWLNNNDSIQIQLVEIENMGHGMPVMSTIKGAGVSGDYLLDAPLSAALMIPRFWRLY